MSKALEINSTSSLSPATTHACLMVEQVIPIAFHRAAVEAEMKYLILGLGFDWLRANVTEVYGRCRLSEFSDADLADIYAKAKAPADRLVPPATAVQNQPHPNITAGPPASVSSLHDQWATETATACDPTVSDAECDRHCDLATDAKWWMSRARSTGPAEVLLKIQAFARDADAGDDAGYALLNSIRSDLARLSGAAA